MSDALTALEKELEELVMSNTLNTLVFVTANVPLQRWAKIVLQVALFATEEGIEAKDNPDKHTAAERLRIKMREFIRNEILMFRDSDKPVQ